uniref:DNA/RNA non-specific endonuclease n=1 Tax=Cupriavidus sp. WS TaxID=1312922 RepID=UPI0018CA445B
VEGGGNALGGSLASNSSSARGSQEQALAQAGDGLPDRQMVGGALLVNGTSSPYRALDTIDGLTGTFAGDGLAGRTSAFDAGLGITRTAGMFEGARAFTDEHWSSAPVIGRGVIDGRDSVIGGSLPIVNARVEPDLDDQISDFKRAFSGGYLGVMEGLNPSVGVQAGKVAREVWDSTKQFSYDTIGGTAVDNARVNFAAGDYAGAAVWGAKSFADAGLAVGSIVTGGALGLGTRGASVARVDGVLVTGGARTSGTTGSINYGVLDALGRPTGIKATITEDMINTGTVANPSIVPPGWAGDGMKYNQARGHLLGRQLGGSGDMPENLVTLQQNWTNSPVMRGYESQVRAAVESGQTVEYHVTPVYKGNNLIPRGVTLSGQGNDGFHIGVSVLNPIGW